MASCSAHFRAADTAEPTVQPAALSEHPNAEPTRDEVQPQVLAAPTVSSELKPLVITAVGDVNMGSAVPTEKTLPADGGETLFAAVREALTGDVVFGNLEGPLADGGTTTKCSSDLLCYAFRTPTAYARHLQAAGFTVMGLANNHALDFGSEGRKSTLAALDRVGIAHTGPVGDIARLNVRGRQLAVIGFSTGSSAYNLLEIGDAAKQVRALKDEGNLVIVSFHGGAEGLAATHITDAPESLGREPRGHLIQFAHAVVDAGADLVLGHGPHVVRGIEVYRGRLVVYSLGNFCTYGRFSLVGPLGHGVVLSAELDPHSGTFLRGHLTATLQEGQGGPKLDPLQHAIREIQALTATDFRFSSAQINDDGSLFPGVGDGAGLLTIPDAETRGRVRELMLELAGSGIPDVVLRRAFSDRRAELDPEVHEKFEKPVEALPYEKYRSMFIRDEVLKAGATFMKENASLLDAIQKKYHVNREVLTSILAVETRFGLKRGAHHAFNALVTVALGGDRRRHWARSELDALLTVYPDDPLSILGSYAGAVGLVQFLPSNILRYGQDWDQDGRIDLDSWPDALASAANYLKNAGFKLNGPLSTGSPNIKAIYRYNPAGAYAKVIGELSVLFGYPLPKKEALPPSQPLLGKTTDEAETQTQPPPGP
jgi:membrane-bound lytic murein transglycosylase B/poly-gamma-glutamate capsule biosynthesis protein CapA/YwtB (metallophosphatase superfamily)